LTSRAAIGKIARNGAPEKAWQSVQWHTITRSGSAKAVKETALQKHWPVMCIMLKM
jgi:hypothetical protein